MTTEVVKAVATGVVTLVVGFVLFQLQQGGRRGALRREIRAELELIEDLGDRPAVVGRLNHRVDELLERYSPDPAMQQPTDRVSRVALVVGGALMAVLIAFLVVADDELSFTGAVLAGSGIGVVANVAGWLYERRRIDFVAVFEEALSEDDGGRSPAER